MFPDYLIVKEMTILTHFQIDDSYILEFIFLIDYIVSMVISSNEVKLEDEKFNSSNVLSDVDLTFLDMYRMLMSVHEIETVFT